MTISTSDSEAVRKAIRDEALSLGFSLCGFADARRPWAASERLRDFVAAGYHGQMGWMEETLDRRAHPTHMWSEASTAVVLGLNYGPETDPLAIQAHPDRAGISVYAQGDDYHDVIKSRLKVLGGWIARHFGCELKVFVDTAPLMEKPLAQLAGLGWQGKHTNLVSRDFGSWLFLGVILLALPLPADAAERDHCGSCSACLNACPTEAFVGPYQLDARKCLSYLTIEYRGAWPKAYRLAMGNRIYGCDDCLAVCPWNKFAQAGQEAKLSARDELKAPRLFDLLQLDDPAFRALFRKSPVKRIGLARFIRNCLYAAGNAGEPDLVPVIRPWLTSEYPEVRGAAVWALRRLTDDLSFSGLASDALKGEEDPDVRAEWMGEIA
ncbi:MAG: tRNA epoxyqueuosine(34) reductase QueG [Asticcacaulis sp.]